MITCARCSAKNQPHYKFCLSCGAVLPSEKAKASAPPASPKADSGRPKRSIPPVQSIKPIANSPPKTPPKPAGDPVACPNCEAPNPPHFKFCGSCGYPLAAEPAASTPPSHTDRPASASSRGKLVLVRPDGSETEGLSLGEGRTLVGRKTHPGLELDHFLSLEHASFEWRGGKLVVSDLNSRNGVYRRIPKDQPVALSHGMYFRVGQHVIRFEDLPAQRAEQAERMGSPRGTAIGRIRLVIGPEIYGNAYLLPEEGLFLGRERGDVLFPEDGYISGLHCRLHPREGGAYVTDLGSSNGTFVRITEPTELNSGDFVLVGLQLLRAEYKAA